MTNNSKKLVSIIVPTRNQHELLQVLINGLDATAAATQHNVELVIANNASDETDSIRYLASLHNSQSENGLSINVLDYPGTFNYSAINNFAAALSEGELICFMNNDVEIIDTNWLDAMVREACETQTGTVGALLLYPDDTVQHAGIALGIEHVAGHLFKNITKRNLANIAYFSKTQTVSANTGACLLIRREVFNVAAGFDEKLKVAFNDVDLCLKVQHMGYENRWVPQAVLYHHESKTRGKGRRRSWLQRFKHLKELKYIQKKWPMVKDNDPHQYEQLAVAKQWLGMSD